jgi:hypothetical protein
VVDGWNIHKDEIPCPRFDVKVVHAVQDGFYSGFQIFNIGPPTVINAEKDHYQEKSAELVELNDYKEMTNRKLLLPGQVQKSDWTDLS